MACASTASKLAGLGVPLETQTELLNNFTIGLGMSKEAAMDNVNEIALMGAAMFGSMKKGTEAFAQAQKITAVYSGRMQKQVFGGLAAAAKAAGVEMSTLLKVAGGFDTFEGAADQAGE